MHQLSDLHILIVHSMFPQSCMVKQRVTSLETNTDDSSGSVSESQYTGQ